MPLRWSIDKINDTHLLHNTAPVGETEPPFPKGSPEDIEGDDQWAITNNLIHATMYLGMSSITEANADKFYMRLLMFEVVDGPSLYKRNEHGHKVSMLTYEAIERRIGLSTNATTLTDAQFKKRLWEKITQEALSTLNQQKRKFTESKEVPA